MRRAEIKKTLSRARCEFWAESNSYGIFSGELAIRYSTEWNSDETFLRIRCQANDIRNSDTLSKESTRSFRNFPGLSGWYACQINTEHRFDLSGLSYESPERAEGFIALIRDEIEKRNLAYVYPDCVMSQIVAALETLGCPLQLVEVNRKPYQDWRRDRLEVVAC